MNIKMNSEIISFIATTTMKYFRVILTVVIIFVITPSMQASADELTIVLQPGQGKTGSIIQVQGSSFTPSTYSNGDSSDISMNFAKVYFPDTNNLVITTVIDAYGQFTGYFTIGEYPAGSYRVWACDENVNEPVWAYTYLTIIPQITLNKSSGYAGEVIDIEGTGYCSLAEIQLLYNGNHLGTAVSDENGSFQAHGVVIPEATGAKNTIIAVDPINNISSVYFYSRPQKVVIYPGTCRSEDVIRLEGSGFRPERNISVCLYNTSDIFIELETTPEVVTANDTGQFSALVQVPYCPSGTYILETYDGINRAAASLQVITACILDRFVGFPGSKVSFNGSGFLPNTITIISFDDIPTQEAISNDTGKVSAKISIPQSIIGDHTISVTDGVNTESFIFTILSKAKFEIDPENASIGSGVNVNGSGFSPGGVVVISFDNTPITEVDITINGTFSSGFTVPVCNGGEHEISGSDGTNDVSAILNIETKPPPSVTLLTPDNLQLAEPVIILLWEGVFDFSGIIYHLQIATSPDFTEESMCVDADNLTSTTYIYTVNNKVTIDEYPLCLYWRVRAEDLASNKGPWSSIRVFEITAPDSRWTSYTLITEVAILSGFFVFWLVKKKRR
ncbi:MAG: hypothetical protein JSU58_00575 [Dehalococcoidales bacterium]|nr:MAG: hypothetical protein JSU58_00575 [Dehalococcoidales bacterium]